MGEDALVETWKVPSDRTAQQGSGYMDSSYHVVEGREKVRPWACG